MKNSLLLAIVFIISCQKEISAPKPPDPIQSRWRLVSFTDNTHRTYTNSDPCFADDWLELKDGSATISQGQCIEFPGKDQTITFSWTWINANTVDMGGDTVKILTLNDSILYFRRDDPQFLEYRWKK